MIIINGSIVFIAGQTKYIYALWEGPMLRQVNQGPKVKFEQETKV